MLKVCFRTISAPKAGGVTNSPIPIDLMVEQVGLEPTVAFGLGFTIRWGYQFSYYSKLMATLQGFEPQFPDPNSGVLPLDDGVIGCGGQI